MPSTACATPAKTSTGVCETFVSLVLNYAACLSNDYHTACAARISPQVFLLANLLCVTFASPFASPQVLSTAVACVSGYYRITLLLACAAYIKRCMIINSSLVCCAALYCAGSRALLLRVCLTTTTHATLLPPLPTLGPAPSTACTWAHLCSQTGTCSSRHTLQVRHQRAGAAAKLCFCDVGSCAVQQCSKW
jgi:hypothetical protein